MKNLAIVALVLICDLMSGCSHSTETTNNPETPPENLPSEDVTGVIAFVNVNVAPMTEDRIIPNQTVIVRR